MILSRKSGLLFTALYLKQVSTILQKYYGGISPSLLPVMVSLTRSGLPRIIPSFHREVIRRRDDRADAVVRMYLSWCSLSKVVLLAKPVTAATFSSITDLPKDDGAIATVRDWVAEEVTQLLLRYVPWIATVPLELGMKWEPTWTSTPTRVRYQNKMVSSIFVTLPQELAAFGKLAALERSLTGYCWSSLLKDAKELIPFAVEQTELFSLVVDENLLYMRN